MIKVHLLMTRIPVPQGLEQQNMDVRAHIDPRRIDTLTEVTAAMREQQHLPPAVRTVIRYDDVRVGYRLMYVGEPADDVARARRRELNGEDSGDPDFGAFGNIEPA